MYDTLFLCIKELCQYRVLFHIFNTSHDCIPYERKDSMGKVTEIDPINSFIPSNSLTTINISNKTKAVPV